MTASSSKPFTGRKLLFTLIAFFGVVIAVNIFMAVVASRSFTGAVVKNGYVASQDFNHWLAEGRRQDALGWDLTATPQKGGVIVDAAHQGRPLGGYTGSILFRHPMNERKDMRLPLRQIGPGRYVATGAVPAGRWHLFISFGNAKDRITVRRDVMIGTKA